MNTFYKKSDEYQKFSELKDKCRDCEVYEYYKQIVQSEGNAKNPTFMFCGECPGKEELAQKKPMIGPAGQELRKHLREFGFNKNNSILTNVLPCRPLNNKFPTDWNLVLDCYKKWLLKEIQMLKPKFIITCGAPALRAITNIIGVGKNRGRWHFENKIHAWVMPTWHPSYVLRCKNNPLKKEVPIQFRNDLKKVNSEWLHLQNDWRLKEDASYPPQKKYNKNWDVKWKTKKIGGTLIEDIDSWTSSIWT